MRTFEQMSLAFESERAVALASKATKIAQELRRPRQQAPRLGQLRELPPTDDETLRQRLERRIAAHLPAGRLALAITDNRHTMISVRRETAARGGPVYRVRLHHMFAEAPPMVARALARYIALNERGASRELGSYIDANQGIIRRVSRRLPPPITLETCGEHFDLQDVFESLNHRYFGGRIDARITWGPRGGAARRRVSIKMGSYSVEDRLIRIHPSLDRRFVPRFFLEWIVYHEMLHQVHDIPVVGGRRRFHTPAFMRQERAFLEYDRARLWERQNLDRILLY